MKLVVLGSGTSVPHPKRSSSCYWLETVDGARVLLDAGADAPHRLAEEQLDWTELDAIWVSHYHWDHFAGLPALLFGLKPATRVNQRSKKLTLFGGEGFRDMLYTIDRVNSFKLLDQIFPIEIVEVDCQAPFQFAPDTLARVMKTPHTQESLALRFTDKDHKSFAYTSDTGFCEGLIPFCRDVDLLVIECSFRKNKPQQTHLELAEAAKIAAACSPKKLVLTHLYAEWDPFDVAAEARSIWPGEVIEATDGLQLNI
jgi:ribonuclease BN (tRNA processing enzyme)